jgi:hypothetical protein
MGDHLKKWLPESFYGLAQAHNVLNLLYCQFRKWAVHGLPRPLPVGPAWSRWWPWSNGVKEILEEGEGCWICSYKCLQAIFQSRQGVVR